MYFHSLRIILFTAILSFSPLVDLFLLAILPKLIIPVYAQTHSVDVLNEWSDPQLIPFDLIETPSSTLVTVENGAFFCLVFDAKTEHRSKDIYLTCKKSGIWTAPLNLSKTTSLSGTPRLTFNTTADSLALHIIWIESTDKLQLPWPEGRNSAEIFYTTNETGTWSKPRSIFHTQLPGLQLPKHLVVDEMNTVHLTFVAIDPKSRKPTIYYIYRTDGQWSSPRPITNGRYVDLVALNGGQLFVTYLRPDWKWAQKMKTRDINSVFVQHSLDNGTTWSNPILVHRSGTQPAFDPCFLKGPEEYIHLFWRKNTNQSTFPNTLLHSQSPNGTSWSKPVKLTGSAEGILSSFDVTNDTSGTLHAVFHMSQYTSEPHFSFYYVRYSDGSWHTPHLLLPERFSEYSKPDRGVALTVVQDTVQIILPIMKKDTEGIQLYHITRPVSRNR